MTFLQPLIFYGLPVVLLPVLIHLLNRLRYKTVKWAAVMFLISATRSSIRHARLRHYLVLAVRCLAILAFLLAIARPLVGGWLGMAAAGSPDTIIILLDRSASMEATDPRRLVSKRADAVKLFADASKQIRGAAKFVVIENALRTPQEIGDLSVLGELSISAPTDTAADLPAMFRAALDYIVRSKCGRTEIWAASDLQKNNWRPESAEWQTLAAQYSSLPQKVNVRILALCDTYGHNIALSLHDVKRRGAADRQQLSLGFDLAKSSPQKESFPIVITLDGVRSQSDVVMDSGELLFTRKFDIAPGRKTGGWGKAELPSDENLRDNALCFTYGISTHLRAAVVSDNAVAGRYLLAAAAPAPARMNHSCDLLAPDRTEKINWQELSLLIWQAPVHGAKTILTIREFVENGGQAVFFSPAKQDVPGPFGMNWGKVETAVKDAPFRIAAWEENEGPVAKTEGGQNLPLAKISIQRRQDIVSKKVEAGQSMEPESSVSEWHAYASYADGKPFLLGRHAGNGTFYICTSLPGEGWSTLGEGTPLVVMIQRMLADGGERFSRAVNANCGEWRSLVEKEVWTAADSADPKDYRWQAGVYECGNQRVALNVPARENNPDLAEKKDVEHLLGDVKIQVLQEFGKRDRDVTQSEIWRIFLFLCLAWLMAESGLLMSDRLLEKKETEKTGI